MKPPTCDVSQPGFPRKRTAALHPATTAVPRTRTRYKRTPQAVLPRSSVSISIIFIYNLIRHPSKPRTTKSKMSNSNNYGSFASASSSTYISSSSSFSSSNNNNPSVSSHRYTETMTSSDRDGTTIRRSEEQNGQPTLHEETYYPPAGGRITNGGQQQQQTQNRIEDVTDSDAAADQAERDRLYEERMEDEYAKREGGA